MYLVVSRALRIFTKMAEATHFADKEANTSSMTVRVYMIYVGVPIDFDELLYVAEPGAAFKNP